MIDEAEAKAHYSQQNEYQVRSTLQTQRTKLLQLVRNSFEQPTSNNNNKSNNNNSSTNSLETSILEWCGDDATDFAVAGDVFIDSVVRMLWSRHTYE